MPILETDPAPALLAAVDRQCFAQPWDEPTYAGLCAQPAVRCWLLRDEEARPAGLAALQQVGEEGELYRIGVVPGQRRRGLGSWLLTALLAALPAAPGAGPLRVLHLEVRAGNTAARRLYERAGFAETGRRRGYYAEPPDDAVCYGWTSGAANRTEF